MAKLKAIMVAGAMILSGGGATASETQQRFDLSLAGLRVATVGLAVRQEGARYSARGTLRGRGVIGTLVNLAFEGTVQGATTADGALLPERYVAVRGKGDKSREVVMRYAQGVPRAVTLTPPRKRVRPYDIAFADQRGTLDPISAAAALLPDRPAATACDRVIDIFDGTRRSRIFLGARQALDGGMRCAGVYERIAGYSPKSMREQTRFNFVLRYRAVGEVMQLMQIEMETEYGRALARRR